MTLYRNSKIDTYTAEGLDAGHPCEVRIAEDFVVVSYKIDDGFVIYEGRETEKGHYALSAKATNGKATLHKIPDEDILEGSWLEGGYEGMWRIELEE